MARSAKKATEIENQFNHAKHAAIEINLSKATTSNKKEYISISS